MPYDTLATSMTPALIVFLIDVSGSMTAPMGEQRRIDTVRDAFWAAIRQMVLRSTKGAAVAPRYRVALLAYSQHVYDMLDGVKTIDEVAKLGPPPLEPMRTTQTAKAFIQAERILQAELSRLANCPAPVVCHLTDGEFTGEDPEPVVRRIMGMRVPDGHVLVENIFVSPRILQEPVADVKNWPGLSPTTPLASPYAEKLRTMSSRLPDSYVWTLREFGYGFEPGALMMLPATTPELVALGFQLPGTSALFTQIPHAPERAVAEAPI